MKNATLPELFFRTGQALDAARLQWLLRVTKNVPLHVPSLDIGDVASLALPEFHGRISSETANWILDGGIFTLSADATDLKRTEERLKVYFCTEVRPSGLGVDIRQMWEPARLQHLALLISCIQNSCDNNDRETFARFGREAVCRWIEANPFLYGPHYTSAMECGLRIPVFSYGAKYLLEPGSGEWNLVLDAIYRHAWWVSRRLSIYSSLGNHTVAECIGLVFAGGLFRSTVEGKRWLKTSVSLLEKEVHHQILPDGGPAEQSINYHRFVLDLYWLAVNFLEDNGLHDCSRIKERLAVGEEFYESLRDEKGYFPSTGDSDDGCAVGPGIHPAHPKPAIENRRFRCFRETGYSVFRLSNDVVMTFDHGPLGMPPLYNHGHADALSMTFSKGGKPLLVDPGTYRYNGVPEWRKYFKGTRAHNTVTVDGMDQADQETSFIWSHPYNVEVENVEETPEAIKVVATHDGYKRLNKPVRHRRAVTVFKDSCIVVRDSFEGDGNHVFELNYHLHPDAVPVLQDGWWRMENKGQAAFLKLMGNQALNVVRGRENPILGWHSPSYGIKQETNVLCCVKEGLSREVSFLSVICMDRSIDEGFVAEAIQRT